MPSQPPTTPLLQAGFSSWWPTQQYQALKASRADKAKVVDGWWLGLMVLSHEWSCSTLSPVSTGMGDHLWVDIPPRYVTTPTRSTPPCIPLGLLNRVPAYCWDEGGNVASARCAISYGISFCSGEACLRTAILCLLYKSQWWQKNTKHRSLQSFKKTLSTVDLSKYLSDTYS